MLVCQQERLFCFLQLCSMLGWTHFHRVSIILFQTNKRCRRQILKSLCAFSSTNILLWTRMCMRCGLLWVTEPVTLGKLLLDLLLFFLVIIVNYVVIMIKCRAFMTWDAHEFKYVLLFIHWNVYKFPFKDWNMFSNQKINTIPVICTLLLVSHLSSALSGS